MYLNAAMLGLYIKIQGPVNPTRNASDCYETKVMTWDGGSRWWLDGEEVGG